MSPKFFRMHPDRARALAKASLKTYPAGRHTLPDGTEVVATRMTTKIPGYFVNGITEVYVIRLPPTAAGEGQWLAENMYLENALAEAYEMLYALRPPKRKRRGKT